MSPLRATLAFSAVWVASLMVVDEALAWVRRFRLPVLGRFEKTLYPLDRAKNADGMRRVLGPGQSDSALAQMLARHGGSADAAADADVDLDFGPDAEPDAFVIVDAEPPPLGAADDDMG